MSGFSHGRPFDIVIQARQEDLPMSDQFWLAKAQLKRLEPFFPRTRGVPRVDDRRVVSGIVRAIRNGLRWRDAPARLMTWQRKWPSWFERRQRRHRCLDMAGDCFARR